MAKVTDTLKRVIKFTDVNIVKRNTQVNATNNFVNTSY